MSDEREAGALTAGGGILTSSDQTVAPAPPAAPMQGVEWPDRALKVCLLGGTGSIGDSTLDVIASHPERFRLQAISGHRNLGKLAAICARFAPPLVAVPDPGDARWLEEDLRARASAPLPQILSGADALAQLASDPTVDLVMAAIVGAAGLASCLAAAQRGKLIALANKEALVMSGSLMLEACRRAGARLLPVDSEHNAVFQCLPFKSLDGGGLAGSRLGEQPGIGIRCVSLTASGGPFRTWSREAMRSASIEQAVAHPRWKMGRKISVDSATLMNKGLELIEAHWLFGLRPEQLRVLVHPQSIVHALVQYDDGSVLAELGHPDMRSPIAHVLAWAREPASRLRTAVPSLDLAEVGQLVFEAPDEIRFPALRLARQAMASGGNAACVLNAANEVAVDAFLDGRCDFLRIAACVDAVLQQLADPAAPRELADVLESDRRSRAAAESFLGKRGGPGPGLPSGKHWEACR